MEGTSGALGVLIAFQARRSPDACGRGRRASGAWSAQGEARVGMPEKLGRARTASLRPAGHWRLELMWGWRCRIRSLGPP